MNLINSLILSGAIVCASSTVASASVATVNGTAYDTLDEAFAAADGTYPIVLTDDVTVTTAITVNSPATLDLAGHTITNNVANNRLFRVGNTTFTIEGNDGTINTSATSFGVVDLTAGNPDAKLVINGGNFTGTTNDGAYFKYRTHGQTMELNNVNATVEDNNTNPGIVNATGCAITLTVNGGNFRNNDTSSQAFVTNNSGNVLNFTDATIYTVGQIALEVVDGTGVFTNCTVTNASNYTNHYGSCIGIGFGADVTVNGGNFSGPFPLYIYNSGGELTVNGGTFDGTIAALKVDNMNNNASSAEKSLAIIKDGTFNGPLSIANGDKADLEVYGGKFSDQKVSNYLAPGLNANQNSDGMYVITGTVTSIESIVADDGTAADGVYNLSGVRVADSIEGIAPGLYIVNGKTILVR